MEDHSVVWWVLVAVVVLFLLARAWVFWRYPDGWDWPERWTLRRKRNVDMTKR